MFSYASDFVKLPRAAVELAHDPVLLTVFVVLLERARYHAGAVVTAHGGVEQLEVGQCVCGRDELAKECGTSAQRIRTALARLVELQFLQTKSTKRGTLVTLCGFKETYPWSGAEQPSVNQASTKLQPPTETRDERRETGEALRAPPLALEIQVHEQSARVRAPKPAPKRPREQRPTASADVRAHYQTSFKNKHGKDAYVTIGAWAKLGELEKALGARDVCARITNMLARPAGAWPRGDTIATLVANIDHFVAPYVHAVAREEERPRIVSSWLGEEE